MATWSKDELDKIGSADELQIAPRRRDGTLRTPVTIWLVRQGAGRGFVPRRPSAP